MLVKYHDSYDDEIRAMLTAFMKTAKVPLSLSSLVMPAQDIVAEPKTMVPASCSSYMATLESIFQLRCFED